MKKIILLFCLSIAFSALLNGQHVIELSDTTKYLGADSRNGFTMPAKGHIHMLVVYVQFKEDTADILNEYWPKNQMPYYAEWLFHPDTATRAKMPENIYNFSDYFRDMSFGHLQITADFYPELITISNHGLRSYNAANTAVVEVINKQHKTRPGLLLDLQKADKWALAGAPAFHPKPNTPNNRLDFVLFIYRNSGTVSNWIGATGGVSAGFNGLLAGMGMDNGYTISGGIGPFHQIPSLIHELAHPLLGGNEYHNMSGTHSINLNSDRMAGLALNGGWGLMSEGNMFKSTNAWERERLGWQTGNSRIYKLSARQIPEEGLMLNLRDYVTYGDAIQIKLPNIDSPLLQQYLWIENHQMLNYWDSAFLVQDTACKVLHNYLVPGIYMYYQMGMDDLKNMFVPREDFLKPISAEGSWDYEFTGEEHLVCYFGAREAVFRKAKMNPLTGYNDINDRYFDIGVYKTQYIGDGEIFGAAHPKSRVVLSNNKCFITADSYNTSDCGKENNPGNSGNIDFVPPWVEEINGEVKVWQSRGPEESFQPGSKIGLGRNPTTASTNYRYKSRHNRETNTHNPVEGEENKIFLNGISVEVLKDSAGIYKVKVRKNDWDINEDIRWCGGNIVLYDTVNVKPNVAVLLNQSETPASNFKFGNGKFAPPTKFTCKAGAYFHLEDSAKVIVEEGSTLVLDSGSRFEIHAGARLVVKGNSGLVLNPGCELFLHNGATVEIQQWAELQRHKEAKITLAGREAEFTINGEQLFKRNKKKIRRKFRD